MISEIVRQRDSTSRKTLVKTADLKACWNGVGSGSAPGDTTLRQWLEICRACSSEALQTLRAMTEKSVLGCDRITKTFLYNETFRMLASKPQQQGLVLEIFARCPKTNGKVDLKSVFKQAENVARFIEGIEFIVPRKMWSTNLAEAIDTFAFLQIGHYVHYVKPHQQGIDLEVRTLEKSLPRHAPILEEDVAMIVRASPLPQIRAILEDDPDLRSFMDEYDQKYAKTKNDITKLKLQIEALSGPGNKTGDDSSKRDKDDGDGADAVLLCVLCNPPKTARCFCPNCQVVHLGDCTGTHVDPDSELGKERPCKDCKRTKEQGAKCRGGPQSDEPDTEPSSPSATKEKGKLPAKRAKATTVSLPASELFPKLPSTSGSDGDRKLLRREENTRVHECMPLNPEFTEHDLHRVKTERPAMLMFISLSQHEHLLHNNPASSSRLKGLFYHLCKDNILHPKGTVIVSMPVPYYAHAHRIVDHLLQTGLGLTVEDHGLVVEYGSRAGGLTAATKKKNIAGSVDFYIVAHHNTTQKDGSLDFTCNMGVTPENFSGRLTATTGLSRASDVTRRCTEVVMHDVPYKGTQRAFHNNVARFATQRFTNRGDTVVTFSAESDGVIESALHFGRRVEAFVATADAKEDVASRVEDAWESSWRDGHFSCFSAHWESAA